ncbi:MAG: methylenetetrahydrofolate reductase [Eubacteriales bacterium]|nr:methylenetetrahydrofolate reductase [Eubacteriales bacterium]MDD3880904.1 methylenetetrahydrofolate reductase [Eubacteriales bacterium]MDD4511729.1 methylenetetrahydrofolate reductase [Eubacteriales bacterium]
MRISSCYRTGKVVFSVEIYPPKKETGSIDRIYVTAERLSALKPDFISVTYGAGANLADNSTCEIASNIKSRFGIETAAHLTCVNSTREEVSIMLSRLKDAGIENVMALRGDINPAVPPKNVFRHANELAIAIQRQCDFCILGACYPEGHYESRSLEADIENLKYKIGAGVEVLISQLFLDNSVFYRFMDKIRAAGIAVPVSAGIMPIVRETQINKTIALSGTSLPHDFTALVGRFENDPDSLYKAGVDYAAAQINDLIDHGVDGVHMYCMNRSATAAEIYEKTFGARPEARG